MHTRLFHLRRMPLIDLRNKNYKSYSEKGSETMARPIPPTPDIETEEDWSMVKDVMKKIVVDWKE